MDIRVLLSEVANAYRDDARKGRAVLSSVKDKELPLPPGLEARGFSGMGTPAHCPWVGVFDPDVTRSGGDGLYLAYIYAKDFSSVSLTLQQGVDHLIERPEALGKTRKLHERLQRNVQRLRIHMPRFISEWNDDLNLKVPQKAWRPRAYEAGSVAARKYEIDALPVEAVLRGDLWQAEELLQFAAAVERRMWFYDEPENLDVSYSSGHSYGTTSSREEQGATSPSDAGGDDQGVDGFRPKDSGDYLALIRAHIQRRERRHEALISDFTQYIRERGYEPHSVGMHPRDLVLRKAGTANEWMVEAKVVKACNARLPVREAVGQLFEYRHFLYESASKANPYLVALFTEDIHAFSDYLESHGIASVWKTPQGWAGSKRAVEWELCDED